MRATMLQVRRTLCGRAGDQATVVTDVVWEGRRPSYRCDGSCVEGTENNVRKGQNKSDIEMLPYSKPAHTICARALN